MKYLACAFMMVTVQATLVWATVQDNGPLTLEQCIAIALKQNQQRRITQLGVETAEAQMQQALSTYWPQLSFETAYHRIDEDINYIFPKETSEYTISGLSPLPQSATVTIPEKEVKAVPRDNIVSRLQMVYPLCTGGLRKAMVRQAEAGIRAARQVSRRSELQLIYDVQRMYYAAVLARRLSDIGEQTLMRLQATMELTETLYKGGSRTINKRDYLRSKVFYESARSIVTLIQSNVELIRTALANTMGLAWNSTVELAENHIPYAPIDVDLDKMVAGAYRFNPDWKQLQAAVDSFDAKVSEEKSHRWPQVGITGTLWRWDNDLNNSGLATEENRQGWAVGLGLKLPLFSGCLTIGKIRAARTRLEAMKARQLLFKGGLAMQIKNVFLQMTHARQVQESARAAAEAATQHRDLTERAYRIGMAAADDVIESQIMESLTQARAEESLYSYSAARYRLNFLVGAQVERMLQ